MNLDIAISNCALMRALPRNTKICVDRETLEMTLDRRWFFASGRRYWNGDSRKDLEAPIRETFRLICEAKVPIEEIQEILRCAKLNICPLYPEFEWLFDEIQTSLDAVPVSSVAEPPLPNSPNVPYVPNVDNVRHRSPEICIEIDDFHDDDLQNKQNGQIGANAIAWNDDDDRKEHATRCCLDEFRIMLVEWVRSTFS